MRMKIAATALLAMGVSGCSWFENYDRNEKYLEAESIPRVVIPEGMDKPEFTDALRIPDVIDSRGIAGKPVDLGLPDALSTTFGVEQIVIKKLGDARWIFLDLSPATVWPRIIQYFEENNFPVQSADPREGVIETEWISSRDGSAGEIYESISSGTSFADSQAKIQSKFRLTIEPGIRSGSSEVYLEHMQSAMNIPVRRDSLNWDGDSDNPELEGEIITKLAYFLGEHVNQSQSISLLATTLQDQRAELFPDKVKPTLKYKLDFDRAWATVGDALENARVEIEDLDRTSHIYYVYYDLEARDKDGFFSGLFSRDDEERVDANRYLVHLDTATGDEEQVVVTVMKDTSTPADALVAERLLKIIKESST